MDGRKLIVIRDRRTPYQFTVHNMVIDEWFPIIGPHGFALYALYCRMAGKKDERSYPSIRMIKKHYRMSTSTISDHNKLLAWCGLIHVESGGMNSPNEYYVLNVPKATPERLLSVREAVHADQARKANDRERRAKALANDGLPKKAAELRKKRDLDEFALTVLRRLDGWSPISTHWKNKKRGRPEVVRPQQLSLIDGVLDENRTVRVTDQGDPLPEQPDPATELPDPRLEQRDPAHGKGVRVQDQGDPAHGEGVRVEELNNPYKQSTQTIQKNSPNSTSPPTTAKRRKGVPLPKQATGGGDAGQQQEVVQRILDWMGFNGRLNHKDNNPSTELLLAWALWVRVRGADESKNPPGVARSKWRLGVFPESSISGYTKGVLDEVLQLEPREIEPYLEKLAARFSQVVIENQIPHELRHIIKR